VGPRAALKIEVDTWMARPTQTKVIVTKTKIATAVGGEAQNIEQT
jgi:hypothetical protein